ncbi:MAG: Ycf34 family protein [Prochlorococcaceae cyanobacterium]
MCICVDCHWVDRCQAYHAVERQHGVAHLQPAPDFSPHQPRIHVQVCDLPAGGVGVEWDVRACGSFQREQGRWLRLRPDQPLPR